MDRVFLYIHLDDYLAQWFIHDQGGTTPVHLQKGSVESKIFEVYLQKRPANIPPDLPGEGKIAIVIPCFKYRPPEVYNFLPKRAVAALVVSIRNRFDIELWRDLHHFGKITRRQDELIYAWMEKNGIEMTEANWNAIAKRYQRQRDMYLKRERAKCSYNRKKKK